MKWIILVMVLVVPQQVLAQFDVAYLTGLANPQCVHYKNEGICFKGIVPGVEVSYWEPWAIAEVTKHPATTTFGLISSELDALLGNLPANLTLLGGASNSVDGTQANSNLHVLEVHLLSYPRLFSGPCTGCDGDLGSALPTPLYVSELDRQGSDGSLQGWRQPMNLTVSALKALNSTAAFIPLGPLGLLPIDVGPLLPKWGYLYPRVGLINHHSEPVAAAVAAARAQHIWTYPTGVPIPEPHANASIINRLSRPGLEGCMQIAYPRKIGTPSGRNAKCMPTGYPAILWDHLWNPVHRAKHVYHIVLWRKEQCCVSVDNATCGLGLFLTSSGDNLCETFIDGFASWKSLFGD